MLILHLVSLLMGEVLYLLPPPFMFLSKLVHSLIRNPVLIIAWEGVPLGVVMQHFLVTSIPWILLVMRPPILVLWPLFLCFYSVIASFFLQNSVYVSFIEIFVASSGMFCLSCDTLSSGGSSFMWGVCFSCGVSCYYRFSWCVAFTFSWPFGARNLSLFPNRFPSMLGVLVLFAA